ncbi:autotransporter assembly complex family protein [Methylocella sp.]|uniref:autotransporter assembly complex family protein n=1 Tax=Methylocella sp. TaxID=1978226 RepID=UPI003782E88F
MGRRGRGFGSAARVLAAPPIAGLLAFPGRAALAGLLTLAAAPGAALAFDFFGLFGSEKPLEPTPQSLPYAIDFVVEGDEGVKPSLQDASVAYRLRRDPPSDGAALALRVGADFAPLLDALWAQGYFNAKIFARVGGAEQKLMGAGELTSLARAAEAYRGRALVPVTIVVHTGELFALRRIAVLDGAGAPFPPDVLPDHVTRLKPGDPAKAADIRAANARLVDYFRARSYPLVKAPLPQPVVDHANGTVDVAFTVTPGPQAGFGAVSITGPQGFDPAIVRSFVYLQEGQPYTPRALSETRRSITSIPAVGSVRIREADHLDASGNLPVFIEVGDRANNLVGFTAGYSTVDGPMGNVYYENRNLFGGAESLRLDGAAFYTPRVYGLTTGAGPFGEQNFSEAGLGGRVSASFVKPALWGSRVDFLASGAAELNRAGGGDFGGYAYQLAGGTAALRYRVDESLQLQAGLKFEKGEATDSLGRVDYAFLGVPLSIRYDGTNDLLNPTQGFRLAATVTPYPGVFGSAGFTKASVAGSAYYAIDESADYVLAARAGFGSIFGVDGGLASLPANYRFYEGGLATLRGYRYNSVGPRTWQGYTVGGLSAFNATLEARLKVWGDFGVAPFFDVGGAYCDSIPSGGCGDTRMAAGLGLLYYTPIGPIRVDFARPLNPRDGDYPVAFYVSIGQPF